MSYSTSQILRDANGNPIPQIWDESGDQFVPYQGKVGIQVGGADVDAANPVPTQLSGRTLQKETIISRSVRTSVSHVYKDSPNGAIGAIFSLNIYGVTGSFEAGEGVNLSIVSIDFVSNLKCIKVSTNSSTLSSRMHQIYWFPGADIGDAVLNITGNDIKKVALPLPPKNQIVINITGTFAGEEGIDCDVTVEWIV